MGRFYKTATPNKLDFAMQLPEELMTRVAGMEGKAGGLIQGTPGYLNSQLQGTTFEAWSPELNKRFEDYESQSNSIAGQLQGSTNYSQLRKALPQISQLRQNIHADMTRGGAFDMISKYKQYNAHIAQMQKDKVNPQDIADWATHFKENLQPYQWDETTRTGTSINLSSIPDRFDHDKYLRENLTPAVLAQAYQMDDIVSYVDENGVTRDILDLQSTGLPAKYFYTSTGEKKYNIPSIGKLANEMLMGNQGYTDRAGFDYGIRKENLIDPETGLPATQERYNELIAQKDADIFSRRFMGSMYNKKATIEGDPVGAANLTKPKKASIPAVVVKSPTNAVDKESFKRTKMEELVQGLEGSGTPQNKGSIKDAQEVLQDMINSGAQQSDISKQKILIQNLQNDLATNQSIQNKANDFAINKMGVSQETINDAIAQEHLLADDAYDPYGSNPFWEIKNMEDPLNPTMNTSVPVLTARGEEMKKHLEDYRKYQDDWYEINENNVVEERYIAINPESDNGSVFLPVLSQAVINDSQLINPRTGKAHTLQIDGSSWIDENFTNIGQLISRVGGETGGLLDIAVDNGISYKPNSDGSATVRVRLDVPALNAANIEVQENPEGNILTFKVQNSSINSTASSIYADDKGPAAGIMAMTHPLYSQIDGFTSKGILAFGKTNYTGPDIFHTLSGDGAYSNAVYQITPGSNPNSFAITLRKPDGELIGVGDANKSYWEYDSQAGANQAIIRINDWLLENNGGTTNSGFTPVKKKVTP